MNKFLAVLLVLLLCFNFAGCQELKDAYDQGASIAESQIAEDVYFQANFVKEYFEKVAEDSEFGFVIFREKTTDVLYLYRWRKSGYAGGCSMSVMYDADGLPLTYSKWLELQEVSGDG